MTLEVQRREVLNAERQGRKAASDAEAQRVSLEDRLAGAQCTIDALIGRIGQPSGSFWASSLIPELLRNAMDVGFLMWQFSGDTCLMLPILGAK